MDGIISSDCHLLNALTLKTTAVGKALGGWCGYA